MGLRLKLEIGPGTATAEADTPGEIADLVEELAKRSIRILPTPHQVRAKAAALKHHADKRKKAGKKKGR